MAVEQRKKSAPTEGRRQRRKLTDQEKVRLALDRFAPLKDGRRMEEISALGETNQRDPAVVSRAITDAFKKRLVEIREVPTDECPRDNSLEEQLRSTFNLPSAVVIRFDERPQYRQGKTEVPEHTEELRRWNDRLHSALGFALARVIAAAGFVFGRGSRVGIGSGRGVFFAIQWLSQMIKLQGKNVEAFSLTGATYPQTHAAQGTNLRLDADTNVNLFAGDCFASPVKPHFVHSPIIASAEERKAVYARAPWLSEDQSEISLSHAIVGVGAFTWGHRLYEEGKARSTNQAGERIFDAIGPELVRLAHLCDQCSSPTLSPVADICHRLLVVQPPAESAASNRLAEMVQDCITAINRKRPFITIGVERLKEIENIMLVAGGPKKAGSIRLLLQRKYPVTLLCTDHVTAREVLKEHRMRR